MDTILEILHMPMSTRNHNSALLRQDSVFTPSFLRWIESQPNSILLETTKANKENFRSYVFHRPVSIIRATSLEQIYASLSEIETALRNGYWVAGYLAYEAGYAFENVLKIPVQLQQPLLWFGVYEEPWSFNHKIRQWETGKREVMAVIKNLKRQSVFKNHSVTLAHPSTSLRVTPAAVMVSGVEPEAALTIQGNVFETGLVTPSLEESEYAKAVARIQQYIAEGDTYQVNFTFKVKFPWKDTAASLYCRLREAQPVGYSAFINCGTTKILSFSPELFFWMNGNNLTLKPMKGTAPRGRTLDEDKQRREELQVSAKNHAENLMIVDLLRNDAGKIAETGSVTVPRFFDIEQYQTIYQATSTVKAKLRPEVSMSELIKSLFPCGSVTGAPKIRTMQIIRELEREPRGVYTGSIGFFSPKRTAQFNVAIRTIVLDKNQHTGEMGIGSGIVADSDIANEYEECLLKAKFLIEQPSNFQLFETIRWEPKKRWSLLPLHLKRLKNSAQYFGFVYDPHAIKLHLGSLERKLRHSKPSEGPAVRDAVQRQSKPSEGSKVFLKKVVRKSSKTNEAFRVKLALNKDGEIESTFAQLESLSEIIRVGISSIKTDSRDRFYFHKTTHRKLYDEELKRAQSLGLFDVLFFNECDELTEGARSNVLIKKNGTYFTPPVECGVLPGTYRSHLIESKKLIIEEKVLRFPDLQSADEIFVCNALRGLIKVEIQKMSQ